MRTYMARLGSFEFGIDTAAFKELQRVATYRWQAKNRIGRKPAQQFTGEGADTITLNGVIYPHYRGGLGQLSALRAAAGLGLPQMLVYAFEQSGQYCGRWCVTSIDETRTVFFQDGRPRKIEFRLTLVDYGEDDGDLAGLASNVLASATARSAGTAQLAPGIEQAFAGAKALAGTVAAEAGAIAGALTGYLTTVQAYGASLGAQYNKVVGSITGSIDAATGMKGTGNAVLKILGREPGVAKVVQAAETITTESSAVVGKATRSSVALNEAFGAVVTAETPDELVDAMRAAQRNVGSLSKLAGDSAISANRIREAV